MGAGGYKHERVWVGLLLALVLTGCGPGGPRVVTVTGTVTRGGRPVDRLAVNFLPEHGRASWGATGPGGQYHLHYERGREGAVTGRHTVWVELRPATAKEDAERRAGVLRLHPEMKAILDKYGNPLTSPLKVEVRDNGQVIDLALE